MNSTDSTSLKEYRSLFMAGRPVPRGTVKKLVGRILRGKDESDFQTTTNDIQRDKNGAAILDAHGHVIANRPLVLCVNGDALGNIIGVSNNTYAMLNVVGYATKDIEDHYRNGIRFKLVVFPDDGSSLVCHGTWDNMIDLAAKIYAHEYPEIGRILDAHRAMLKAHSFDEIVRMDGQADWSQVQHGDPQYMGPGELMQVFKSGRVAQQRGLVAVRRFFFDALHLRRLYSGDGWTYSASGQRGEMEYPAPTCQLSQLGNHDIFDLPKLELPKAATSARRASTVRELPVPSFFNAKNAESWAYGPDHDKLVDDADAWRKKFGIRSATTDAVKIFVLDIDNQCDFSLPGAPLFVAGRSGTGAVDDNVRFTEWKYRNLGRITRIINTMDTHPLFAVHTRSSWLGVDDRAVAPFTTIPLADIEAGRVRLRPAFASMHKVPMEWADKQIRHYAHELMEGGMYELMAWATHCALGSRGHALVGITEEARAFHAYVRGIQDDPEIKGGNPWTENYGIMSPEVLTRHDGGTLAQMNTRFFEMIMEADILIVGGQAASHCTKSSIAQILKYVAAKDRELAKRVWVLRDCMSAVVTPFQDYTDEAEAAIKSFADAGMNVVDSATPMEDWPGIQLAA